MTPNKAPSGIFWSTVSIFWLRRPLFRPIIHHCTSPKKWGFEVELEAKHLGTNVFVKSTGQKTPKHAEAQPVPTFSGLTRAENRRSFHGP